MRQQLVGGINLVLAIADDFCNITNSIDDRLVFVKLNTFLPILAIGNRIAHDDFAVVGSNLPGTQIQER